MKYSNGDGVGRSESEGRVELGFERIEVASVPIEPDDLHNLIKNFHDKNYRDGGLFALTLLVKTFKDLKGDGREDEIITIGRASDLVELTANEIKGLLPQAQEQELTQAD